MTKINKKIVEHVARLARLTLKKSEIKKFGGQLSDIFDFIEQISEMKTKGVKETSQVTGKTNLFRKDQIDKKKMLTQKQALSNAKRTYQGYFVVESILDK